MNTTIIWTAFIFVAILISIWLIIHEHWIGLVLLWISIIGYATKDVDTTGYGD